MLGFITKTVKKFVGSKSERDIREVQPIVEKILAHYSTLQSLSNDELRAKTAEFKDRILKFTGAGRSKIAELKAMAESTASLKLHEKEDIYKEIDSLEKSMLTTLEEALREVLPEAFAVVKETARRFKENAEIVATAGDFDRDLAAAKSSVRIEGDKVIFANKWMAAGNEVTWDMLHYDVQLIGGIVLHEGKIAEMATGEGKTLVATLPLYLNALAGKGVHLVTVNDYLARRDSEWMGPIFEFHGLRVDCIDRHQPNSDQRKRAYEADITYGTNNEFGFDYLRDNMARTPEELVQRKHHFSIVDEVDSVLIDDARTPLIISGPTPRGDRHEFHELKPRVEKLVAAQKRYISTILADARRLLSGLNDGEAKKDKKQEEEGGLALLRSYRGLPKNKALIKFLSEPGVKAHLQKTENFYMQDQNKEMHKADAELFFVIDERHNSIELTEKGIELITESGDDKNFFVLPDINLEITGIEKSSLSDSEKLAKKDAVIQEYTVKADRIHTINQLLKAYCLFELDVEYVIMDGKIKIVDEQTGRIMEGRRYSDGLHQAIEAKENVKVEAATQTYATITLQNYFRMYHKLAGMTGTAETEAQEFWDIYKLDVVVIPTNRPITRDDREDLVYKTNREKYAAVIADIESLVKEGRPALVGTTSVEISELLSRMLKMKNIKHNVLNAKLHQREAEIVAEAGKSAAVTIATNMAGRGTDIKLTDEVRKAGGLAILGTERHESRRVDRQLRGRSGRQGDVGTSQFFVSLEDGLMRLFGSQRIAGLMDRLGLKEGEVIQHSMITRSIERAQKKVEENNFSIRKRLLEYDDIMNSQREVIYTRRRHALYGERLSVDIANMLWEVSNALVTEHQEVKDYESFRLDLLKNLGIETPVDARAFADIGSEDIAEKVFTKAVKHYQEKSEVVAQAAMPVIRNVFEKDGSKYRNIVVPFTDGKRSIQIVANLEKCMADGGKELIRSFEKNVILAMIDDAWKEHLRAMDDLKQSVQGAVYEQKDPLLIYKFEAYELFRQMLDMVNWETASFLVRGSLPMQSSQGIGGSSAPAPSERAKLQESRRQDPALTARRPQTEEGGPEPVQKVQPVRVEKKVGRNDPCPCGSGKKYKQCHGRPQAVVS